MGTDSLFRQGRKHTVNQIQGRKRSQSPFLSRREILKAGAAHHLIESSDLCRSEPGKNSNSLAVEAKLSSYYGNQYPIHGLIGQTWRNSQVCGKVWVGVVDDYVASSLFADDFTFNYYE